MRPDQILDNANVITIDPALPRAGSIAVLGDRILALGEERKFADSAVPVPDLSSRCVEYGEV